MALQDILKEVEERSSAERTGIQEDHDSRKNEILRNTEKEIARIEEDFRKKTADDTSALERREKDLMELEAKRIIDGKKNELISGEAGKASELVRNAGTGLKRDVLLGLMLKSAESKLGKDLRVRCSPENESFFRGRAKDVVSDLRKGEQGIICISSDGKKELNLSMEFILRDIHENILDEISRKARVV